MINEIVNGLEQKDVLAGQVQRLFNNNDNEFQDRIKTKEGCLPDKFFMARNSLLTDLLEVKHIQTIYHMFLGIFFGLFVNNAARDLIHNGNIHTLAYIWIFMFLSTLTVYAAFHCWTSVRIQLGPKSTKLRSWDRLYLAMYVAYFPCFIFYFTNKVVTYELTIAESVAALSELTRFLMKSHAFIRSTTPRAVRYKPHSNDEILCPAFSKYLYFLFAPTLVYQDDCPRSKCVSWRYVCACFLEVLGCIFYVSFIFEHFLISELRDFGLKKYSWLEVTLVIMGNIMAGMLVLLCAFYGVIHAWMNGFAEMLRFGDRMFYKDWWTSTTYGTYYRTWNVVIHDWLYIYIYKDLYEIIIPKNKVAATLTVFFLSAGFHEFILGFSFRFCCPIHFVLLFGIGSALSFQKCSNSRLGNVGVLYGLAVGVGFAMSMYCIEYYARLNCPIKNKTVASYFIPRSFTCNV